MARVAGEEVCCFGLSQFCDDASQGIYLHVCVWVCVWWHILYAVQPIFQVKKTSKLYTDAICCVSLHISIYVC